jgi:hypothetical protein
MAWPFTSAPAYTFNQGPSVVATGAPASITTAQVYMLGGWVINTGSAERTLTMTDSAGGEVCTMPVPPTGQPIKIESLENLASYVGLKAGADGAGLKIKVWGY